MLKGKDLVLVVVVVVVVVVHIDMSLILTYSVQLVVSKAGSASTY